MDWAFGTDGLPGRNDGFFCEKFQFDDWCMRASLFGERRQELEAKLLHAREEMKHHFNVVEKEQGGLLSFEGESVYIQAIKREVSRIRGE